MTVRHCLLRVAPISPAMLCHAVAAAGASLEANIRAMHTLAGFCPQDVLLAAWHNDTFRSVEGAGPQTWTRAKTAAPTRVTVCRRKLRA